MINVLDKGSVFVEIHFNWYLRHTWPWSDLLMLHNARTVRAIADGNRELP